MNQFVRRPVRSSGIPDVIFVLLIANGVMFAAQNLVDGADGFGPILQYLALWPIETGYRDFHFWQILSYGFLHGDFTHILFNMVMLWMFGRDLELTMGRERFLTYFLVCVVGAGIVQLVAGAYTGSFRPTIGASGGVFGVLLAYGMMFPNRTVMLLIPPVPMQAKYVVILAGVMQFFLGVSGADQGVAHFAHLGGMAFGFFLLRYWSRQGRRP